MKGEGAKNKLLQGVRSSSELKCDKMVQRTCSKPSDRKDVTKEYDD